MPCHSRRPGPTFAVTVLVAGLAWSARVSADTVPPARSFDGAAALRHASALAALGPHPWGSPRSRAAAAYVAAQLKEAGVPDVQLPEFERAGIRGLNAVGTLPGPGSTFVVVAAHHDTAPEAPGAYDDGGGVGVMIETARVLAARPSRPQTIVFVSFDGEEAWWTQKTTVAGSREYMESLGPRARDLSGAFVIEMSGWKGGSPVLHPIAYPDPLRPGRFTIAPGWLVSAALGGARRAGASFGVGDPLISWVYQPAVRTFQIRLYGDDLAILQAGRPAVFAADSSFTAFYPWYHRPTDTPDKLDAGSLARMGTAVLGAVDGIAAAPPGPAADPVWFVAFGRVLGAVPLAILGLLALVPGLVAVARAPVGPQVLRILQAVLLLVLAWRHPIPTGWVFVLPLIVTGLTRRRLALVASLLPFFLLMTLGGAAWARGMTRGVWFASWEIASAVVALAILWVPMVPAVSSSGRRGSASPRRIRGLGRATG